MHRRALLTALVVSVPTAAMPAFAQRITGTVTSAETGDPLAGVFVKALQPDGQLARAVLTDSAGRFVLQLPRPGAYALAAERIGQETVEAGPFHVEADQVLPVKLESPRRPIALEGIEARGERRCTTRPDRVAGAARVWEEARKALEVTRWAAENADLRFQSSSYRRALDPTLDRVLSQSVHQRHTGGHKPFAIRDPALLADSGYAMASGDSIQFYGPDAEVLLSDAFLDHHCFDLTESDDDAGLVGLRFRPAQRRRQSDIEGTLWIERATGLLRWLDYSFVDFDHLLPISRVIEGAHPTAAVTGRTEFRRLDNGIWIVDRWWIRMPVLGSQAGRVVLTGWAESGGVVLSARWKASHESRKKPDVDPRGRHSRNRLQPQAFFLDTCIQCRVPSSTAAR